MSVRVNGDNTRLSVNAAFSLDTNAAFSMGVWVKLKSDTDNYFNLMTLGTEETSPTTRILIGSAIDGTGVHAWQNVAGFHTGSYTPEQLSLDTWYWIVIGHDGSQNITTRVFNDTTSTTPLSTVTCYENYASGTPYLLDWMVFGESITDQYLDAEIENAKFHEAVYWTDEECRIESQNYDIQTSGGTQLGSWRLKDTDADVDGLNDNSGNGYNLSNTGCTNGASTPGLLSGLSFGPGLFRLGQGKPFQMGSISVGKPFTIS